MKCSQRITLGPYKETYCDLEVGHVGNCLPAFTGTSPKRCPAQNPDGVECGLPKNHFGQHQNGLRVRSWSDDKS